MKHKTWFRLVLKAIGVLLIGLSIQPTAQIVMWTARTLIFGESWTMYGPSGQTTSWLNFSWAMALEHLLQFIPPALQLGFGLYLLLGGEWIVNKVIPSNRKYCPDCGYDLSNSRGERCPECGVMLPRERDESGAARG